MTRLLILASLLFGLAATAQPRGFGPSELALRLKRPAATSGTTLPSDLANLVAWWKADTITNTDNGSTVIYWVDSKSSIVATNGGSDTGGIYTNAASGQNGLPYVSFADSSIYRLRYGAPSAMTSFTVIMSLRVIANTSYGGMLTWHESGSEGFALGARSSTSWIPHLTTWNAAGTETQNKAITTVGLPTNWRTLAWTYDGSSAVNAYTNNTADTVIAGESGWGAQVSYIGYAYEQMQWSVGEIIIFSRVLNSTELGQMQTYLKGRWNTE